MTCFFYLGVSNREAKSWVFHTLSCCTLRLSFDCYVFASQVLAYLDADMELCVLDTRAGTELEHASLSTLGMSLSPILPPPPSSQPSSFAGTNMKANAGGNLEDVTARGGGADGSAVAAGPGSATPMGTFHNAFRACEGRLYLLGRQEMRAVRVQGWSQRVESLVQAGEWLEALAVALDHYEQKILPMEQAAAAAAASASAIAAANSTPASAGSVASEALPGTPDGLVHGSIGDRQDSWKYAGGRGYEGDVVSGVSMMGKAGLGGGEDSQQHPQRRQAPRSEAAEHISQLLVQYLRLAINNAPAAESASSASTQGIGGGGGSASGVARGGRINLAHSHFQMLAGVCTEFCAVTGRLDILFGQVFHAFRARGQQG